MHSIKKASLVIISICFLQTDIKAQPIKILFDASKAETAGNADWVIDASLHNIGFNNGPAVVGGGSESNPAMLPLPAQSGINSGTPETFWDGGISYWGIDAVNHGYIVQTLPYNGLITYGNSNNVQDLSNYKVFIIPEPNIVFTTSEKTAIINFVQNGGGLFMISDHDVSDRNNDGWDSPHIWNDLMTNNTVMANPFGMNFDYADFSQTTTNIPSLAGDSILHGPMGNVAEVQWSNGTTLTLTPSQNSSVKGIIYKTSSSFGNTNVMCAYSRFGLGRVAAIGDSSPIDDGTGDSNDVLYNGYTADAAGNHRKLLMNITIWLAGNNNTSFIPSNNVANENITLFPVPANEQLTIDFSHIPYPTGIKVFDVSGKLVYSSTNDNDLTLHSETVETSLLPQGMYLLECLYTGEVEWKKFIVAHHDGNSL